MLNSREVDALQPGEKQYNRGCGDGLLINVESVKKGGGKSWRGSMRFKGKQITVVIGSRKKYSLKEAQKIWTTTKCWSLENDRDPRDYKKKDLSDSSPKSSIVFGELVDVWTRTRREL